MAQIKQVPDRIYSIIVDALSRAHRRINTTDWSLQKTSVKFPLTGMFYTIVAVSIIFYIIYFFIRSPLGYDDSYNLQVSQNLATYNLYATNGSLTGSGPRLFDPLISTGPTLLIPIAVAVNLFGNTLFASRVIPLVVLAFFIYVFLLYAKGMAPKYIRGRNSVGIILFGLTIALISSNTESMMVSAVGEILSFSLLMLSVIFLAKRKLAYSGLLVGLAILTKLIIMIALPILLVIVAIIGGKGVLKKSYALFKYSLFIIAPVLLFELYRLYSFNYNLSAYKVNLHDYFEFIRIGGSGLNSTIETPIVLIVSRLKALFVGTPLFDNPIMVVILSILFVAIVACLVLVLRTIKFTPTVHEYFDNIPFAFAGSLGVTWLFWWLIITDHVFVRHVFGALLFMILFAMGALMRHKGFQTRYNFTIPLCIGPIALLVLSIQAQSWEYGTANDQRHDAGIIAKYYNNATMYHFGWWQNPEIQYLNDSPSLPYNGPSEKNETVAVLMSKLYQNLSPEDYKYQQKQCSNIITVSDMYQICIIEKNDD